MDHYLNKLKISRRHLLKYSRGFIGVSSLTVLLGNYSKSYAEGKMSKEARDYLKRWNTEAQISSISPISLNIIETLVKEPHMKPIDNTEDFYTATILCTLKDGTVVKMFRKDIIFQKIDHIFLADSKNRMIFGSYPYEFPLTNHNEELKKAIKLIADQKPKINLYDPREGNIPKPVHKIPIFPKGFDRHTAMELGNLVRIAYKDYDNSRKQALYLEEGDTILTSQADKKAITQYWINSPESSDKTKYTVIKILKAEEINKNHNFGFILEQKSEQTNEKIYFVVLRGTISPYEWIKDANFELVPPGFEIKGQVNKENGIIKVSKGFDDIYKSKSGGDDLYKTVQNFLDKLAKEGDRQNKKIYVTGHSLGAALATLSTLHIAENNFSPTLYAFASPRVGNPTFAQRFSEKVYAQTFRIANSEDLVNGLPTGTITEITGPEMKDPNDFLLTGIIEKLPILKSIFSKDAYEHVGQPVYFSHQTGAISSNHNMSVTYCGAI